MKPLSHAAKYWDFSVARRMTQEERDQWLEGQHVWHELLKHETGEGSAAFAGAVIKRSKNAPD